MVLGIVSVMPGFGEFRVGNAWEMDGLTGRYFGG